MSPEEKKISCPLHTSVSISLILKILFIGFIQTNKFQVCNTAAMLRKPFEILALVMKINGQGTQMLSSIWKKGAWTEWKLRNIKKKCLRKCWLFIIGGGYKTEKAVTFSLSVAVASRSEKLISNQHLMLSN